jgi:uncharacterized protein (TIGR03086 family)
MADDPSDNPAQQFREIGGRFGDVAAGVRPGQWDDPSPVEEWTARDVVRHLVEWFPSFLASGAGVQLPPGPSVDEDPVGAWRHLQHEVQAMLDDPATGDRVLSNRHIGDVPLPEAVSRFFTGDVFMHTWDLARATGQDDTLDPELCAAMLAGMEPIEDAMRGSGQYGPPVEVPADADPQTRLLGFIGRDPSWQPPHR